MRIGTCKLEARCSDAASWTSSNCFSRRHSRQAVSNGSGSLAALLSEVAHDSMAADGLDIALAAGNDVSSGKS